jgi:hypothetical protein
VQNDTIVIFSRATGLPVIIDFTSTLAELRDLGVIEMGNSLTPANRSSLIVRERALQV